MTPVAHPPYSPDLALGNIFLFPWIKKRSQREMFYRCGIGETKMAEALKGIKIDEFKTDLISGQHILIGVLHQMESTLKVIEV